MKVNMKMQTTTDTNNRQAGFASVVVALIMVLVLGLVTVGFAKLSRQEQESALNKQLSAQAYYAAESGINDARHDITQSGRITADGAGGTTKANPNTCMTPSPPAKTSNKTINSDNDVTYSCLLVDLTPPVLQWTSVQPNSDRTLSFDATNLNTLNIKWNSRDASRVNNFRAAGDTKFMRSAAWNSPAVIQFNISPVSGAVSRSQPNFTVFMYPSRGGSNTTTFSSALSEQGRIVSGNCVDGVGCTVNITGLAATGSSKFLIHMFDYYDKSDIAITGVTTTGAGVGFSNGQAKVDVTGKARNVLKRLQVRFPINQVSSATESGQSRPNYALEAQNICKRIKASANSTTFDVPAEMKGAYDFINSQDPGDQDLSTPCKLDD